MSDEHEKTDSGSSLTYPSQAGQLKKGDHVVIKDCPCKIVETSTSKTGKHGHAKIHIVAVDIFTGKKYEDISPTSHNMDCPNIKRTEFLLMDINDGFLSLLTEKNEPYDNCPLPEGELGDELQNAFNRASKENSSVMVTVIASMGKESAISYKEGK